MERIAVETTAVVVLADGASTSDTSNRRGHLLEAFVAQLLWAMGYSKPTTENLNVKSEGVEIDVQAHHRATQERVICECKAYSSTIAAPALNAFLGKFALARADDESCKGLFVGLPRLTADAKEQAKAAERKLKGFRYLSSYDVCLLLAEANLLPSLDDGPDLKADPTVVITEHGLALAARELDPDTRRAFRTVVWTKSGRVPIALLKLVERSLADGLPVTAVGEEPGLVPVRVASPPTIVEVQGSSSDFEYQLPAAPEFFVGRKTVAGDLARRIVSSGRAGVIVINAKSGWGKSSLALRVQRDVERRGGAALVVDSRTADRPEFATVALERLVRKGLERRLLSLPEGAAMSSLPSIVETLRNARWRTPERPLLIVFDQFENVFRSPELTKEFRDLAFLVKDLPSPLTVAFSWKIDVVGWTEDHPYRLRDEIRAAAQVVVLEPFGPREVETLLRRLEREVGDRLHRELRQRLREYSQGLPWLFKKFAGHILTEVRRGVTQEQLVRQALNVQVLFENDLARLTPAEQEALRAIARTAPVLVSELDEETIPSPVLESLLHHQRLVVQIGARIDTYWDTFRDFLNTGRVAIEDSYVVRYAPLGAGRLLRVVLAAGGDIAVPDAAESLNTSATVVFNYARELRLFGVLTTEANRLVVEPDVLRADDIEEAIRSRVAQALRRHKMHSLVLRLMEDEGGVLPIAAFARALPHEFPTVEAKADSWFSYARSFCQWMDYSGLARLRRDGLVRSSDQAADDATATRLLSGVAPVRVRSAFPGANPGPALQLLRHLASPSTTKRPSRNGFNAAVRDLSLLGVIEMDARQRIALSDPELVIDGHVNAKRLRTFVEMQRGMPQAFAALESEPWCTPTALGEAHRELLGADWVASTVVSVGKYIRAWARACGIETQLRQLDITRAPAPSLWDAVA